MEPVEVEHALAALSARQLALELLLAAVISHATIDKRAAIEAYDAAAREVSDRYLGLPLGEPVLELMEQSLAELRLLLQ